MTAIWKEKSFNQLTLDEMYQLLSLRTAVFVVEQNCPYQELDGKDQVAKHLWLENENGQLMALCRLLPKGISFAEASIGRVLVNTEFRGQNLGRGLIEKALEVLKEDGEEAEQLKHNIICVIFMLHLVLLKILNLFTKMILNMSI